MTEMHAVSGWLRFAPEDREEAHSAIVAVADRSRADPGCVEYWWGQDLTEPGTFRFFECWESEAAFQAHQAQPYEHEFMKTIVSRITGANATTWSLSGKR